MFWVCKINLAWPEHTGQHMVVGPFSSEVEVRKSTECVLNILWPSVWKENNDRQYNGLHVAAGTYVMAVISTFEDEIKLNIGMSYLLHESAMFYTLQTA